MEQTQIENIKKEFPIKNVNTIRRSKLSSLDKLALFITDRVGTMGFFLIIFAWTILWLGWNIIAPKNMKFDPAPAFVLWLFISNLIQLHLMPLLLIGQNLQSKHAELRAEHDFETDKKAEKEIEAILLHLEIQQGMIIKILEKIEKMEEK
jgi:uncharacterized membrane protein